jgi:hypothetical protein
VTQAPEVAVREAELPGDQLLRPSWVWYSSLPLVFPAWLFTTDIEMNVARCSAKTTRPSTVTEIQALLYHQSL